MSDSFRYAHRDTSRLSPTEFSTAGGIASLSSNVEDDSHSALQTRGRNQKIRSLRIGGSGGANRIAFHDGGSADFARLWGIAWFIVVPGGVLSR